MTEVEHLARRLWFLLERMNHPAYTARFGHLDLDGLLRACTPRNGRPPQGSIKAYNEALKEHSRLSRDMPPRSVIGAITLITMLDFPDAILRPKQMRFLRDTLSANAAESKADTASTTASV